MAETARQLHLVDPKPTPVSYEACMDFLRKECKTTVELGEEHDIIKVTCQEYNPSAEKGKQYQEHELPMDEGNPARRKKLIEIAQCMHTWKKRQEDGENVS